MRALAGLLICIAFVLLAACGGGGGDGRLSEEEYFERVEELVNGAEAAIWDARQDIGESGISEDELHARIVANDRMRASGYRRLVSDLESLKPPEARINSHDDLIDSIRNHAEKMTLFLDLYETPGFDGDTDPSDPAVAAYADALEASDIAGNHFGNICAAVEHASDRAGHPIQLDCAAFAGIDEPAGQPIDIAPGTKGRLAAMPPLPDGLVAASRYIEFEFEGENLAATIGLPLENAVEDASGLGFYSYEGGEWVRHDVGVRLEEGGTVASGDFESVPVSLAVLREK